MHIVKMRVPPKELSDLVGLATTLKGSTLLSIELDEDVPMVILSDRDESKPSDPRLVFDDETNRIDVDASLKRLGLTEDYLRKATVRSGTPEHSVKMAMARTGRCGNNHPVAK